MFTKFTPNRKLIKAILISGCLTIALTFLVSCGGKDSESSEKEGGSEAIAVSLLDSASGAMSIDPATVEVKSGEEVTLKVTNDGTQVHNLTLDGGDSTADLQAFSEAELNVGEVTDEVTLYCSIAGHREAGMEMTITVGS